MAAGASLAKKGAAGTIPRDGVRIVQVAGAAAGAVTVTGIGARDKLLQVNSVVIATGISTDLTSEFTITGADTINNNGGTDTSGGTKYLQVIFIRMNT